MEKSQHQAKKAQSMSKDDQDSQQEHKGMTPRIVTRPSASQTRVTIVALCCSLLLFTLIGLLATTYITYATPIVKTPTPTPTGSTSPTATTTPTDTPTPTATPSPTPSPTPTQAPSPTPTRTRPTPTPTQQPTPTATQQPGPTATQQPGVTPTPQLGITPTSSNGGLVATTTPATPTVTTPTPTTSTDNGGGSANLNQTSTTSQTSETTSTPDQSSAKTGNTATSSGSSHTVLFIIIAILTTITVLAAAAFFLARKFLSPVTQTQPNLPPSGARPWSRVRTDSMNGDTNLYDWENTVATHPQGDESDLPFVTQPAFGNSGYPDPVMAMAAPSPLMAIPNTESGIGAWMTAQSTPAPNPDWEVPPAMLNDLASSYGWNAIPNVLNDLTSNPSWKATPEPELQDNLALLPANDFAMQARAAGPSPSAIPSTPTVPTTPTSFSPPTGATGQVRSMRVSRLQSLSQTGQEQEG